jgi:hypothetical protein
MPVQLLDWSFLPLQNVASYRLSNLDVENSASSSNNCLTETARELSAALFLAKRSICASFPFAGGVLCVPNAEYACTSSFAGDVSLPVDSPIASEKRFSARRRRISGQKGCSSSVHIMSGVLHYMLCVSGFANVLEICITGPAEVELKVKLPSSSELVLLTVADRGLASHLSRPFMQGPLSAKESYFCTPIQEFCM